MTPNQIQQLRQAINPQRIVCDKDELARHSHDCSPLAAIRRRQGNQATCPDLIVQPADHQEVSTVLAWASSNQVPVTTWGAGSAVTGAPLASNGGICLDLANLNQTLEINRENLTTRVGAGKLGGELEMELNEHGLTLNHWPSPRSVDGCRPGPVARCPVDTEALRTCASHSQLCCHQERSLGCPARPGLRWVRTCGNCLSAQKECWA